MSPSILYLDAYRAFQAANQDVRWMARNLRVIADELARASGTACMAPFDGEEQPPLATLIPDGKRFAFDDLPDAARLQKALRRRHLAQTEMHDLWNTMSDEDRKGLMPPA